MNMKKGKITALIAALAVLTAFTGCGADSSTDDAVTANNSVAEESPAADESTGSEDEADSESESSSASDSSSADKSSKDESSASKNESSAAKDESSSKSESSAASDSKSSDSSSKSSGNSASGNSDSGNTGSSTGSNTGSTVNDTPSENATADEEDDTADITKFIYLQDTTAQYSGDGITVEGSTITISKGGTYEISGTLSNGQIYILTDKKKVKLHLNGVSITNKAGSAINCQAAKKLTINLLPGSVNYLEDGGTHDEDKGTIFSEDTVNIKGEGELNIVANYAHGIQSDDDITVNGGTVNITAAKSCLHSNDGIEINGGRLYCDGGTNGIKTEGYITITGGSSVFLGGSREEKGAIYCDGSFTVTGGQFWAIGNTCTAPDAATTTANVIGLMFPSAQAAGTIVNVSSGNNGVFTMTSPRSFKYVVYSGPELLSNAEYSVDYGGSCDGTEERYVYFGGSYTYNTSGGTFTAGNAVTFYTVQ